jgi:hypothetical protein
MARASIQLIRLDRTTFTANGSGSTLDSVNGSTVLNDGATFLELHNTSGSTRTVSVEIPDDVDEDLTVSPRVYTVANGATGKTAFFPRQTYGPQLLVDVSGTGVTATAYSCR